MIIAIHQPQYLPYLGYFDKIKTADTFVFLDDVQYKKNEWQNRNKIRNADGWQWITVPVKYSFGQKINQIKISGGDNWRKAHYKSLVINYSRAPYFKLYEPLFKEAYERQWEFLTDINIYLIESLMKLLGISTRLIKASQLEARGTKTERLLDICKKLEASTYLSGMAGRTYLDISRFEKEGINIIFQDYHHPTYKQGRKPFTPCLSIVDLLFNHGPDSLKILAGK